jgi:hypothetical protein
MLFQNQDFLLMQFYKFTGILKINFCAFLCKATFLLYSKKNFSSIKKPENTL